VIHSSPAPLLPFWQWQPPGGIVWSVEAPLRRGFLWSMCAAGWLTVLGSTFLIDHFDVFGLCQVWLRLRGPL
jgi:hypothetical protein